MISSVLNTQSLPINNIQLAPKSPRMVVSGLGQDKFECKSKSLNFGGNKFQIPLESVQKKGTEALGKMSKLKTIDEKTENFYEYWSSVKTISGGGAEKHLDRDFLGDFMHELTGSYMVDKQLEVIDATEGKTVDVALKKIVDHVNNTTKMYQHFIDNNMDSTDTTIGAHKVFGLVMDAFKEKAAAKNIKITVENKGLLKKHSESTTEDYKNYIIMSNIVANAIKYSPEKSHVKIEFKIKENKLHFAVEDQGIGIDPSEHLSVKKGQRASNVGSVSGTGYGLSRIDSILNHAKAGELKIISPLHPESVQKGTRMECNLISDCTKSKSFFERLFGK